MGGSVSILVVDDHAEMARLLADQLGDEGYAVTVASAGWEALELCRAQLPDLAVVDLRMEGMDGLDVLAGIHALDPTVPVLLMTAFGAIESAVEAIRRGAQHYFTKPFRLEEVLLYVQRALEERQLRVENRVLRRLAEPYRPNQMVGRGAAELDPIIDSVAQAAAPVLVRGESGTGKELVARAIHARGPRRDRPFVPVNCTALPENLLESELFGHVKGAFTGATTARRGLFVEADGGTLFLDEIGDMPPELQARLLRVLEDGELRPVGADTTRRVDVRVIAATHQPLEERVATGAFRRDLFFRLDVVPITVPPLRERADDIPLLVEHFLQRARARNPGSRVVRLAPELVAALQRHDWPGNVRELENLIERLVIVGRSELAALEDLELHPLGLPESTQPGWTRLRMVSLRQLEDEYITWVVARCEGNKTRAAEVLGIDVSTIHRRKPTR